ncbi:putative aldouronate transport system permease protein [Paenibacillus sp. UNC496MF]|uniref:ABC transporter permease n=1 Tax=Paenibacillus sp. UNC496MF TaxID=1502753 RepID=UPI0008E4A02D|nr:ABC transporter permease subunit [Paenibacillus sp. UNC496MF]SFI38393.1 putative aldouronate transport system permease protein [Paenibacillus sp. UNC496MF]
MGIRIWQARHIYLLILPTIAFFAVFTYAPFYGITLAFKDFKIMSGILHSPWVGFEHFRSMFASEKFPELLQNTVVISLYRLVFGFPVPILFALLLNEVRQLWFKRSIQTITYFPHFLSWVVFGGIVYNFIGPSGIINLLLANAGLDKFNFTTNAEVFRTVIVVTAILKEFGWGAIIYLAALSGIDAQLYEAAKIDGAGKLRQIWYVTLPGIRPIIALLFCLQLAGILDAGFDQIFIFLNPAVYDVGDIIDTYVYRLGLLQSQFELATAVGLFKGVIGMVLIIAANTTIRRMGEKSLW